MKSQLPNPKSQQNPKTQKPTRPYDLKERTFELACAIVDVCAQLPGTPEANTVRKQLADSGTSVGANVEEADGAVTRRDKVKSFVISRKECRETRYWLRIIVRKWPVASGAPVLVDESTEVLNILSTIIQRLSE